MNDFFGIGQLLTPVYNDLAHPSLEKIGKAFGDLTQTGIDSISERGKKNIKKFEEKTSNKNLEQIQQIPFELSVPILQKLNYYQDESLIDLFTNLLATACDKETASLAHPSFIKIIENITPQEAQIIKTIKERNFKVIAYGYYVFYNDTNHNYIRATSSISMIEIIIPEMIDQPLHLFLDNLSSLNLLFDNTTSQSLADKEIYKQLENHVKKNQKELYDDLLESANQNNRTLKFQECSYYITSYFYDFAKACIKN